MTKINDFQLAQTQISVIRGDLYDAIQRLRHSKDIETFKMDNLILLKKLYNILDGFGDPSDDDSLSMQEVLDRIEFFNRVEELEHLLKGGSVANENLIRSHLKIEPQGEYQFNKRLSKPKLRLVNK